MQQIDGMISDKLSDIESQKYIVFHTYGKLMTRYSHYNEFDPKTYKDPQLYVKALPSFNEVFELFMSYNSLLPIRSQVQDICLSLFYNPYFNELYDKIKDNYNNISKSRLKFLSKHLLEFLADPIQYKIIVEQNMFENSPTRNYYIEKDIFVKSKQLLELIN